MTTGEGFVVMLRSEFAVSAVRNTINGRMSRGTVIHPCPYPAALSISPPSTGTPS